MIGVGYSLSRLTRKEEQIEAAWAKLRSLPGCGLQRATAVVAYNEAAALGVYAAAAERGIRIPEDLSVASFDDFYAAVRLASDDRRQPHDGQAQRPGCRDDPGNAQRSDRLEQAARLTATNSV